MPFLHVKSGMYNSSHDMFPLSAAFVPNPDLPKAGKYAGIIVETQRLPF